MPVRLALLFLFLSSIGISAVAQTIPQAGNVLVVHHDGVDELSGDDLTQKIQTIPWPDFKDGSYKCGDIAFYGENIFVMLLEDGRSENPKVAVYSCSDQSWSFPEWAQPTVTPRTQFGRMILVGHHLIFGGGFLMNFQLDLETQEWYRLIGGSISGGPDSSLFISARGRAQYYLRRIDLSDGSLISKTESKMVFEYFMMDGERGFRAGSNGLSAVDLATGKEASVTVKEPPRSERRKAPRNSSVRVHSSTLPYSVQRLNEDRIIWSNHRNGIITSVANSLDSGTIKIHEQECWGGPIHVVQRQSD